MALDLSVELIKIAMEIELGAGVAPVLAGNPTDLDKDRRMFLTAAGEPKSSEGRAS